MTTLFEPAYAKVNLTLDVLGKRDDGYHELASIMQGISLQDDVEMDVNTGEPWKLSCNLEGIPCDERNLAWKAAKCYCDTLNKDPGGLAIRIIKRIPNEAGMGGGSADAAAVLRALNRYFGEPLNIMELADLGGKIGSDVPFCVLCGTAMCEGRGEILRKLPDMPDCFIVVVKPEFSVSTPALYKKIDEVTIAKRPNHMAMESALISGDLEQVAQNILNVFDPVVSADHPELDEIKSVMQEYGALTCQMTGSGSATFGIVDDPLCAVAASGVLKKNYAEIFVCKPV
jgi:4-diphosphocytidyl-2-C-methyl-D-erythritol kinase